MKSKIGAVQPCVACKKGKMAYDKFDIDIKYKTLTKTINIVCWECGHCNERIFEGKSLSVYSQEQLLLKVKYLEEQNESYKEVYRKACDYAHGNWAKETEECKCTEITCFGCAARRYKLLAAIKQYQAFEVEEQVVNNTRF